MKARTPRWMLALAVGAGAFPPCADRTSGSAATTGSTTPLMIDQFTA